MRTPHPRALARLRTAMAALAVTGVLASGCADPQPAAPMREVAVACVSKVTMTRVDDAFCPDWDDDDDDDGYFPYFYPVESYVVPVGAGVSGGYRTKPAGGTLYYAPAQGGKVHSVPGGPKPVPAKAPAVKPAPAPAKPAPVGPATAKTAPAQRTGRVGFR